jgi:hypothetical protein
MELNFGTIKRAKKEKDDFMGSIPALRMKKWDADTKAYSIDFNSAAIAAFGYPQLQALVSTDKTMGIANNGKDYFLVTGISTGSDAIVYKGINEAGFHIISKPIQATLRDKYFEGSTEEVFMQISVIDSITDYRAVNLTPITTEDTANYISYLHVNQGDNQEQAQAIEEPKLVSFVNQ